LLTDLENINMPLYNIGVVTRLTNITTATLRAWERRYDFPKAKRTSGGHRLYSENDILRLLWVKQKIDEGMQTAQAVNALRHQESTGKIVFDQKQTVVLPSQRRDDLVLADYQNQLLDSLLHFDSSAADQILGEALTIATPESIILEVVAPVMARTGEAWEHQLIDVAVEHFTTNYLRQKLLMWMLSGPPQMSIPPIILACAPDELHEGSLLILGAFLRRKRYPIAYLGQAVPLQDLANFIRQIGPSLVVLVAMTEETAIKLIDWTRYLPEAALTGHPSVGYGGRIFGLVPDLRSRMTGIYLGDSYQQGLETIERLVDSNKFISD
jgi:MerR family transcriptional regulator, light-induced transcriptional regulator